LPGLVAGQDITSQPNILMIVADDLGWNDVSWHNPEVIMPNLDKLAREGLILENNYVQPTCGPSRSALMTGYYPIHVGAQFMPIATCEPVGLPTKFKLLPQYLKEYGYSTHLAGKWHLGHCAPEYQPTNRGFDTFKGLWLGVGDHNLHGWGAAVANEAPVPGYDFHQDEEIDMAVRNIDTSEVISARFSEMLAERNSSQPFFFEAAFQDVHTPLQVQEEYADLYPNIEDPQRKLLLGMASRLDTHVGKMVSQLQQSTYLTKDGVTKSLLEDTLIIFTSDNGGMSEGLGYAGGSNYPLRGRKGDVLEGGTRVPGFVYNFGRTGTSDGFIHITDWLPTLVKGVAGGSEADLPADMDGLNQIELLTQPEGQSVRDEILYDILNMEDFNYTFYLPQPNWPANLVLDGAFGGALRYQNYKIILGCSTLIGCSSSYNESFGGSQSNDRVLLYNLDEDEAEMIDLSTDPQYEDILQDLRERLMFHLESAAPPLHFPNTPDGLPQLGKFVTDWCEPIEDPYNVAGPPATYNPSKLPLVSNIYSTITKYALKYYRKISKLF